MNIMIALRNGWWRIMWGSTEPPIDPPEPTVSADEREEQLIEYNEDDWGEE